jgi:glycosyltransferase involved in cell wall biosynthesis
MNKRAAFTLPIGMTLGASNIWSVQLAGLLTRQGYAADVLVHPNVGWHPEIDLGLDPAIRVLTCPGPKVTEAGQRNIPAMAQVYANSLPGVVVQNWGQIPYATLAYLAQQNAEKLRVIGVGHADADAYYDDLIYYESIIHIFLAVSDEIGAELARRLPHRADDIVVRPCAVFADTELGARRYATSGEPLRITYAGRVTNDQKKMSRVAPFARELHQRGVPFHLRVIGEGGYKKWLLEDVSQLPAAVRACVSIEPGRLPPEMPAIWRDSDICLLLSDFEGTSVSMMEAMAQGCIPVVTEVSGTKAIIREGVNGYTSKPGDLAAMADNLCILNADRSKLTAYGEAAHRVIVEKYSYDVYLPWFMSLLSRVQEAAPRPWPGDKPLLRAPPVRSGWLSRAMGWVKRR